MGGFCPLFFAVDKQLEALEATRMTSRRNVPEAKLELLGADLFTAFRRCRRASPSTSDRTRAPAAAGGCHLAPVSAGSSNDEGTSNSEAGLFDVILFNPVILLNREWVAGTLFSVYPTLLPLLVRSFCWGTPQGPHRPPLFLLRKLP